MESKFQVWLKSMKGAGWLTTAELAQKAFAAGELAGQAESHPAIAVASYNRGLIEGRNQTFVRGYASGKEAGLKVGKILEEEKSAAKENSAFTLGVEAGKAAAKVSPDTAALAAARSDGYDAGRAFVLASVRYSLYLLDGGPQ